MSINQALRDVSSANKHFLSHRSLQTEKLWKEDKIYLLPMMPTDLDEKEAYLEKEYRCSYCDQLYDDQTLECKVCSRVAHIDCLFRRGHLDSPNVAQKTDWSCSDCCDLSKCLQDDEMRKIINIFDELDFKKYCYVMFDDYIRVKKRLYEENGDAMTEEKYLEEERKFRFMDKDCSGSITWNDFLNYESASLIARKNKIELSNHLKTKELIKAKHLFLKHDKEKQLMINKEDSKKCYIEYIQSLRLKLGAVFSDHISQCIDMFGLNPNSDQKTNSAKTMWPEFIRKMTVLLLYDRLNSPVFTPRSWKPGLWYSIDTNRAYHSDRSTHNETVILPFIDRSKNMPEKSPIQTDTYLQSQFGSHEFVIRSKQNDSSLSIVDNLLKSEDEYDILEEDDQFKPRRNLKKSKFRKSYHESFLSRKSRNLTLEEPSSSLFKSNFHLPNLVNSSHFESNSSSNYFPSTKNRYFTNLNSERIKRSQKGFQIDTKHQNDLNIVNKIIANY